MPNELDYPDYESIVELYTKSVQSMFGKKPGEIRGQKGALVENIIDAITLLAWKEIGGELPRFNVKKQSERIIINDDYVKNLPDEYM